MNLEDQSTPNMADNRVSSNPKNSVHDPVCGMTVDPATTAHHATNDGAHYHFCSAGCLAKFTANPAKYLSATPRAEPRKI